MKSKLKGFVQLIRPELPFAAGICVMIGEMIALAGIPSATKLILGFMWGFLLAGPAMVLNDYFDIEVDIINAPGRPLASGLVSPAESIYLTGFLTLLGLTVSGLIGITAVLVYIGFWLIGFIYNWRLKEEGLAGNLMVSSSVAITIVFGGIVVRQPWQEIVWIASLIVFLFNLAEEIAADALDIEGDKQRNIKSVAILYGKKRALLISAVLFSLMIVLSYLPYVLQLLGISYLIIVSCMNLTIIYFFIKLYQSQTLAAGRGYIRRIYLAAVAGMLLLLILNLLS